MYYSRGLKAIKILATKPLSEKHLPLQLETDFSDPSGTPSNVEKTDQLGLHQRQLVHPRTCRDSDQKCAVSSDRKCLCHARYLRSDDIMPVIDGARLIDARTQ